MFFSRYSIQWRVISILNSTQKRNNQKKTCGKTIICVIISVDGLQPSEEEGAEAGGDGAGEAQAQSEPHQLEPHPLVEQLYVAGSARVS